MLKKKKIHDADPWVAVSIQVKIFSVIFQDAFESMFKVGLRLTMVLALIQEKEKRNGLDPWVRKIC